MSATGLPAGTYPHSGIGAPLVPGVMSTEASPSSEIDPSLLRDSVVILSRTYLFTLKATSTWSPTKFHSFTDDTVPTGMPATLTGDPGFNPATSGKRVFRLYCCQKNPRLPV